MTRSGSSCAQPRARGRVRTCPSPTSRPAPSTSGACPSATTSPPTSATSTRATSRRWSGSASTAPPASSTGASSRTSPTRPPTCSRDHGVAQGRPGRGRPPSDARDRGDLLRHLEARARSCSRCRCSTATTASATGSRTRPRRCWSPTPPTRRASTPRWSTSCSCSTTHACSPASPTDHVCEDTSADDPAQLYYTSGTTGKAKGIVHAHRYILAHEEFVYCHDVRDGERFHGMGEWAWAAGHLAAARPVAARRGPVRAPARGRLRPRRPARLPLPPRGHERVHDADRDAGDDGDRRRRRALPAAVPDRLLGRRAAQPRGDPLVPRPVRGHGARLLRAHRVLSAVRELPVHGGARGLDGPADAGLGRADPRRGREPGRRRASAARSACAPAPTRTTRSATGTSPRRPRRPSAASGSTPRTRRPRTRTATSGTPAAPTT